MAAVDAQADAVIAAVRGAHASATFGGSVVNGDPYGINGGEIHGDVIINGKTAEVRNN